MLNFIRQGTGRPLLLVHGLGGSCRSWATILPELSKTRDVLAIDLPGHGQTPAGTSSGTFAALADSVEAFIIEKELTGVDVVGSSVGGRIVLEMARRGKVGAAIALDPGGFWRGWERTFFRSTLMASIRLLRGLEPALPALSRSVVSRSLLLAQLSAHPWTLDGEIVGAELTSFTKTKSFDALVQNLFSAPEQQGPAAASSQHVVIGWGRQDRLCLPRQAARAMTAFPSAKLHWFNKCGHFPMWDQPEETIKLILDETAETRESVN